MIDFEPDPIEEADRDARLVNEKNHCKKRKINGYNSREDNLDLMAIEDDRYRRFEFHEEYTE